MSEYYWELVQHDGTKLEIPPSGVDVIKRRMASGEPINTRTAVIPVNQIKFFRQTDRLFGSERLLEDVARAFNEPQLTDDGGIVSRWVKLQVTQASWNKTHSHSPNVKRIDEGSGMVTIAFRLPVHQIDLTSLQYCTAEEINKAIGKH